MLLTVFILYLVVVMAIAIWSFNKSNTKDDYVLGGRKVSGLSLALSERATGESAWLLLGLTGHAYAEGISTIWVALGCVIGIFFIWLVMAERLQAESMRTGALTLSSMLSRRFPGTGRSIGLLSAIIVVFFSLFYIAAQFSGAGTILQNTFGFDPVWGMVIGSLIVVLYCMLGGFITVVATDVFQSILMIITLIVLPIIGLIAVSAHNVEMAEALRQAGPELSTFTAGKSGGAALLFILSGMSWMFGYTGQPQLLTRMMAMRNTRDVKNAKWVAVIWTLFAYTGAMFIGITGFALIKAGVIGTDVAALARDAEKILPVMVQALMMPVIAGILLSGAISAMMSTASSELMVCSSSLSEDIYGNFASMDISQKRLLTLNKILTLLVGLVAFFLALWMKDTVYGFVSYAWAGIGSAFGPALILLLFWKKLSRAGVYASLLCGTLGTIIWKNFFLEQTGISERLTSYVFAFLMAVLFSLIIPEKAGRDNPLSLTADATDEAD